MVFSVSDQVPDRSCLMGEGFGSWFQSNTMKKARRRRTDPSMVGLGERKQCSSSPRSYWASEQNTQARLEPEEAIHIKGPPPGRTSLLPGRRPHLLSASWTPKTIFHACRGQTRVSHALELELQVACQPPRRCREPNLGPLQEQWVLLTTELSLQLQR